MCVCVCVCGGGDVRCSDQVLNAWTTPQGTFCMHRPNPENASLPVFPCP